MRLFILLLAAIAMPALGDSDDGATRTLRAGQTQLQVKVIGVDDPARVRALQAWIAEAARAPLTVAGRFPLRSARVEIRQRSGDGDDGDDDPSPVPWGRTVRDGDVRVLLYVRANASPDALRDDWTAVHELSHLFHPYLGDDGRWLAEGLASYEQNILRARIGLMSPEDAWRKLDAGFERGRRAEAGTRLDALSMRRGGLMRLYWGGAAFWLEADLALRARGSSLDAVLWAYAGCCLDGNARVTPADFATALDGAGGGGVFAALTARYAGSTQFPSLEAAYRTLGITRRDGTLRFSNGDAAARLRASITTGTAPLPALETPVPDAISVPAPGRVLP